MIKNIIFDLCGVVIDWNPRYLYRKIMKSEEDINFFLANVLTRDVCKRFDLGEDPKKIVDDLIRIHPKYREEIIAYDQRWNETLGGRINGTYQILNELKGMSYNIYGLTNFPLCKFKELDSYYTYIIPSENNMISATEKICKPDPRIYRIFLKRYGLNARECLFIDNSKPYVDEAINQGIRGIHFQSPEQLRKDLSLIGVL